MRRGQQPSFQSVRDEAAALLHAIEAGQPAAIYLFWGADDYQRERFVRNVVSRLLPAEHRETCLVTLDGGSVTPGRVVSELERTSFRFGEEPRRVVTVRDAPWFAAGRGEGTERLQARLEAGLLDDVVLILEVRGTIDRRQKLTKLVLDRAVALEFPELGNEGDVAQFLKSRLNRARKRMSQAALSGLIERCGLEAQILSQEVEKLIAYAGEANEITLDDVREMVAPSVEASIFDLVDALAEGRTREALQRLDELFGQRAEPFMVLGMITRQYRLLLQARYLLDAGLADARLLRGRPYEFQQALYAKRGEATLLDEWRTATAEVLPDEGKQSLLNQHYFPLWKTLVQAQRLDTATIAAALERILQADLGLKTSHLAPAAEIELLVADLCTRPGRGATIDWATLLEV